MFACRKLSDISLNKTHIKSFLINLIITLLNPLYSILTMGCGYSRRYDSQYVQNNKEEQLFCILLFGWVLFVCVVFVGHINRYQNYLRNDDHNSLQESRDSSDQLDKKIE